MDPIRIGTRRSMLAMAQSQWVAEAIHAACGVPTELAPIVTRGDRAKGALTELGGKGLFTEELESALRKGEIHLAVHSAKDLPVVMSDDLVIAAVPKRVDARDAVIARLGLPLEQLPHGSSVGTGSLRRGAQILGLRGDLRIVPIRGNIDTRVRKVLQKQGGLDAVILAMAGLERAGLLDRCRGLVRPLEFSQCIPAAGQGVLVVQAAARMQEVVAHLAAIEDAPSRQALLAERAVLAGLGADCRSCVAVHVFPREGQWRALGMVAQPDGTGMVRCERTAPSAAEAGALLSEELRKAAAGRA
jgi:hydroxymethylbilane synthase